MKTELIGYRTKNIYDAKEWETLDHYKVGYSDGISCCNLHGRKTANYLSKIRAQNRYEDGKKQSALDWLEEANR